MQWYIWLEIMMTWLGFGKASGTNTIRCRKLLFRCMLHLRHHQKANVISSTSKELLEWPQIISRRNYFWYSLWWLGYWKKVDQNQAGSWLKSTVPWNLLHWNRFIKLFLKQWYLLIKPPVFMNCNCSEIWWYKECHQNRSNYTGFAFMPHPDTDFQIKFCYELFCQIWTWYSTKMVY